MGKILLLLIEDYLIGLLDILSDIMISGLSNVCFFPEKELSSLGFSSIDALFTIFFNVGISFIIIKFLKKGFEIYVLWTDGDADADPLQLITNFGRSIIIALAFPTLYVWLVEAITEIIDDVLSKLSLTVNHDPSSILTNIASGGFFVGVAFLVFSIIYLLLIIQFYKIGIELLILRIGMPLACVGLMDADKGVFKSYVQKFFQASFTVLIQVVLAKLSLAMMIGGHFIWGFATASLALRTPKFLQEFLIVSGGGGTILNTAYSGARVIEMSKKIIGR